MRAWKAFPKNPENVLDPKNARLLTEINLVLMLNGKIHLTYETN